MFVSVCTWDKSTVDTLGAPGAFYAAETGSHFLCQDS